MTTREELKEAARKLGAMMAEHVGDFYDVVEMIAVGYGEELAKHHPVDSQEYNERHVSCQLSALNELQSVANTVIGWKVEDGRGLHMSWQSIGDALDISRQAAHERFREEAK